PPGSPKDRDRVARELVDFTSEAFDDAAATIEVGSQEGPDSLRVQALRNRREADEVTEENRDETPFGRCRRWRVWSARGGRSLLGRQRRAAVGTEPECWVGFRSTGRTRSPQLCTTACAEPVARVVLECTGGATHSHPGRSLLLRPVGCPEKPEGIRRQRRGQSREE